MKAIVYTTNTGSAQRYAEMIAQKTGLRVYALQHAPLPKGTEILYVGWLMAGRVQGLRAARRRFRVVAVCGVGMGESGSQIAELRKQNAIAPGIPVFTVQGGFHAQKLHGVYKLMMGTVQHMAGKGAQHEKPRTAQEEKMLHMLLYGADCVCADNLQPLLQWYEGRCRRSEEPPQAEA